MWAKYVWYVKHPIPGQSDLNQSRKTIESEVLRESTYHTDFFGPSSKGENDTSYTQKLSHCFHNSHWLIGQCQNAFVVWRQSAIIPNLKISWSFFSVYTEIVLFVIASTPQRIPQEPGSEWGGFRPLPLTLSLKPSWSCSRIKVTNPECRSKSRQDEPKSSQIHPAVLLQEGVGRRNLKCKSAPLRRRDRTR